MTMHLYELVSQYRSLEALAASEEVPEDVIRDTLEGLGGELQLKATNVAMFIRNVESTAQAIDDAAASMGMRAKRLRDRVDSLKFYLLTNMQAAGITKIECPEFVLSVRKNPPAVVVLDEAAIPTQYMYTPPPAPPPTPRPDKKAIATAIKAGQDVAGCTLNQTERLEIKA